MDIESTHTHIQYIYFVYIYSNSIVIHSYILLYRPISRIDIVIEMSIYLLVMEIDQCNRIIIFLCRPKVEKLGL